MRNAWCHFTVFVDAGDFGFEQLRAAHAQHGQDGDGQDDDAHAAQPVHHVPPEIERRGERVEAGHDGGAGGGQAADGFKESIGVADVGEIKVKGQGGDGGKTQPEEEHQCEAVARAQFAVVFARGRPDGGRTGQRGQCGSGEGVEGGIVVEIGHQRGDEQQDGVERGELGQYVDDRSDFIHGCVFVCAGAGLFFRRPQPKKPTFT